MPQMSPLLWLFLMIMIVVAYGLFVVMNYFIVQSSDISGVESEHQVSFKDWRW